MKTSALAGGGIMLTFSWLAGCRPVSEEELLAIPEDWFELNSYINIGENGVITLFSTNTE